MKKLLGMSVLAATFGCNGAMATLLDFTDDAVLAGLVSVSGGYSGTTSDGIGFGITSSDGTVKFGQNYDGSLLAGCSNAPLACDKDGVGINNDEISSGQILSLAFNEELLVQALYFLDLYSSNRGTEQAAITVGTFGADGAFTTYSVSATQSKGQGGYASYNFLTPVLAQSIRFAAIQGNGFKDDRDNDFSLAAVDVRAVPVAADVAVLVPAPATLWLTGLGLIGLAVFARRKKPAQ